MHFIKVNIIPILLGLLILSSVLQWFKPTYSERNIELELELQRSNIEIESMKMQIDKNNSRYEAVEKTINIDSLIVWNADRRYRDSIRSAVNPR